MRVALQGSLNLQCQTIHATAHLRAPVGQPHPPVSRRHHHRRTAAITRRNVADPISAVGPPELGAAVGVITNGGIGDGGSAVICTGVNMGAASETSAPRRTCLRQFHNRPRLTSCRRATSAKQAPGCSTAATIRSFSSRRQRRRRSTPVIISILSPAPDLNGARTSAAQIADQRQIWLGVTPRMDTMRTEFGRPNSSIRFTDAKATFTSVARPWSICPKLIARYRDTKQD
jgi:hypothetical protein